MSDDRSEESRARTAALLPILRDLLTACDGTSRNRETSEGSLMALVFSAATVYAYMENLPIEAAQDLVNGILAGLEAGAMTWSIRN